MSDENTYIGHDMLGRRVYVGDYVTTQPMYSDKYVNATVIGYGQDDFGYHAITNNDKAQNVPFDRLMVIIDESPHHDRGEVAVDIKDNYVETVEEYQDFLGWDKYGRKVYIGDTIVMPFKGGHAKACIKGEYRAGLNKYAVTDHPECKEAMFDSIAVVLDESPEHYGRFVRDKNGKRVYVHDRVEYDGYMWTIEDFSFDKAYICPTMIPPGFPYEHPITVLANSLTLVEEFSPRRDDRKD